jgi:nitrogen fixation protein FixH
MSVTTMESRLTGKHILLILLGFFALVGVVNAAFVYFAVSTGPGEERGASYEVGLRYNNMLAEERTQNALQWRHQSQIAQGSRLRVSVTDNAGTPVPHLAVTGTFGRPATNIADRSLVFKEVDAGLYEAPLGQIQPGSWVLSFVAEKARPGAGSSTYRVKERLWLSPAS